jgi:hypothetical protein
MFVEKIFADNLIEKFKKEIMENHQSLCGHPYIPTDTFQDKGVAILLTLFNIQQELIGDVTHIETRKKSVKMVYDSIQAHREGMNRFLSKEMRRFIFFTHNNTAKSMILATHYHEKVCLPSQHFIEQYKSLNQHLADISTQTQWQPL